jgi:phenylacetate-CoA ligase
MDKIDLYYKLPIFAQNLVCRNEGRKIIKNRYSKVFWRLLVEYEKRNNWSYEQLCEYRNNKLQRMIKHCYDTVPYYTKMFNELRIDHREIKTIDDLKVLPILTKQIVRDNFNDLLSSTIPEKDLIIAHTGGTTGSSFEFYTTNETISEQWAVWWRYRRNLGIEFDTWCAIFGGKAVVPYKQRMTPFWRINKPGKQLYFSGYHLNRDNYKHYVNILQQMKIKWLHGYSSNINVIASFMIEDNIKLDMNFVTVGSENLFSHQSEMVKKAFGVKPFQHYGMAEGVANISEDRYGVLHIDEDFAAVEILKSGKLIGSTLTNWAMPFLRYDTDDLVLGVEIPMSHNQGGRLISQIDGRAEGQLITKNDIRIGEAAISLIFKEVPNIIEAQLIQNRIGAVKIFAVTNGIYNKADEDKLSMLTKRTFGNDFELELEYVDNILRTSSGKLRFVVSELNTV